MCVLSSVQLFVIPWIVARQSPPSMEFSSQEYWSGLLFPAPGDLPWPGIKPHLLHLLQVDSFPLHHLGIRIWSPRTPCNKSDSLQLPYWRTHIDRSTFRVPSISISKSFKFPYPRFQTPECTNLQDDCSPNHHWLKICKTLSKNSLAEHSWCLILWERWIMDDDISFSLPSILYNIDNWNNTRKTVYSVTLRSYFPS